MFIETRQPSRSTLFPYTTLFRSRLWSRAEQDLSDRRWCDISSVIPITRCSSSIRDRKSTRLNSSHVSNSYADFCMKKKSHGAVDGFIVIITFLVVDLRRTANSFP